ncbi:MAG TPA: RodZ domain-containing protein [Vitreimonas sp.]|uniref:helix-turn-helix domain-containing protein n=1 Tax=Vitreimonas sp. TaxID=3069702 RepID=UPI002D68E4EB|nr:RodZ domain-containing protein [Vitreimonas sp.]HYD85857.1 RodZ domain-containing protein [Vitreimonas sp.]
MLQPAPTDPPTEDAALAQRDQAAPRAVPVLDPAWRAGRKLSEARSQLGLSLDEVAERIRVRREFLEALEEMNVKLLPGKAYALAFLRSYARELGIDEKQIVEQFQTESALSREDVQKQIRSPSSKPHRERPWMAAAVLVLLAASFVGWRALSQNEPVRTVEAPVAGGTAVPAPPAIMSPTEQRVVEIRAVTDAWLEARGPDGTVFLSRTLRAGDVYRPDPSPGWTLHARDGGAFELFVNGTPAGPLGTVGMPVLGRSIDEIRPMAQADLGGPRT